MKVIDYEFRTILLNTYIGGGALYFVEKKNVKLMCHHIKPTMEENNVLHRYLRSVIFVFKNSLTTTLDYTTCINTYGQCFNLTCSVCFLQRPPSFVLERS